MDVDKRLETLLEEYGYEVIGIQIDEDTNTAQKLEENTEATKETKSAILKLIQEARVDELQNLLGKVTSKQLKVEAGIQALEGLIQFRLATLERER